MKCDELKAETIVPQGTVVTLQMYPKAETDEAITELKAENESLKQKLHDAEMRADLAEAAETERRIDYENLKKDLAYHARQIYFKHNRQTLRALWLARAERAEAEHAHWDTIWFCDTKAVLNINKSSVLQEPYRSNTFKNASTWRNMWYDIANKCHAKAEEYK